MRFSRLGVIVFLGALVAVSTGCEAYSRILTRKDVVDGSTAYKERKFAEAERLFRQAAARDPEGKTEEGKIAQLFLARTIHSMYIGNRQDKSLAEKAIELAGSSSELHFVSYDEVYGEGFEDMQRRVPSLDKAKRLVGYQPTRSLADIINDVIREAKGTSAAGSTNA